MNLPCSILVSKVRSLRGSQGGSLRRSSFTSVDHLIDTIDEWADHWNDDPKPFVWHKTAQEIIAKVRPGRAALTHQIKSATDH